MIWIKSNACPGYFLDYFEPIPHVTFKTYINKHVKIDYKGCDVLKDFQPKYYKLKLKPYMKKIIFDKLNILNKNYISAHIRRTDHINLAKKNNRYTTDEDFIDFFDKSDNNKNIYIATDDKITYNKFKKKYQKRIKFEYHDTNDTSLRQTSLKDAIIDIYMYVYSDDLKNDYSSFSDLIDNLRRENIKSFKTRKSLNTYYLVK